MAAPAAHHGIEKKNRLGGIVLTGVDGMGKACTFKLAFMMTVKD